jgi:hypothetical protein
MPKLILVFSKKKKKKIFNRPKNASSCKKWVEPKCQMIRVLKRFPFDYLFVYGHRFLKESFDIHLYLNK